MMTLPSDSAERKKIPLYEGVLKYFPAALAGVARQSIVGNRHTPNEPMHHKRGASADHADTILRHTMDVADLLAALERGYTSDTAPLIAELQALAWRVLAWSQELHEQYGGAPLAPAARLPTSEPKTAPESPDTRYQS